MHKQVLQDCEVQSCCNMFEIIVMFSVFLYCCIFLKNLKGCGPDLHYLTVTQEDAVDHSKWAKLKISYNTSTEMGNEVFFWYQLTLVDLDKGLLNGLAVVVAVCYMCWLLFSSLL